MEKGVKAKGDELIEKFRPHTTYDVVHSIDLHVSATKCAIIAVEEIINAVTFPSPEMDYHKEKWQQVLNYLKSKL